MKKNLTKKLMLSVLTLAFAVVSLGASTFAWFTTSPTATVDPVEAEVIGGSGIEIGVAKIGDTAPAAYYVNELKSDKIKALFANSTYPVLNNITALKTGSEVVFGEKLYNQYGDEVKLDYTNPELGYIAFRLFVKVNAAGTLTLGTLNVTSTSSTDWNAGVDYTNGLEQPVSATASEAFSVTNAARVAVVAQQKNADKYATVANYVYEQAAAAEGAKTGNSTGCSNLGAYQIYNAKQNDDSTKLPLFKSDDATKVTKLNWTDAKTFGAEFKEGTASNAISMKVARDEVIIYDVYLWIEGYDAECVNAIFAHDVKLDIKFNWAA